MAASEIMIKAASGNRRPFQVRDSAANKVAVVVTGLPISGNLKTPVRSLPPCGELNHPVSRRTLTAVDPEAWLADVLEKLVGGWPLARIDGRMPWAPAFKRAGAAEAERSAA
jgi:hypothetical protein